ncbi:transglutaminase-like cysteine peptidase [Bosea sp. (in: a-proteobacteria)]|uniref:transglutaminase-like cysteine peptidase n=1 Tax=Bosea sp. (in: a-proteobacteria) TaxID=1871050 RepID=UPI00121B9F49|nr:transglutaminase-like cysteine peptidase [Bosea sp. (in: a-proteobacteria)]TAJ31606.1 MAG: hypothetical protein EPO59_07820 [Bosea sp. (in: a-proteobacteria)]
MKQAARQLFIVGALALASTAAHAYPHAGTAPQPRQLPSATALADTEPTLAPLAFLQFCKAYEGQCKGGAASGGSISLDARTWGDLQQVNDRINAAIAPDLAKGGFDWSLDTRFGNCNDYAVQKRDALIKMGYPMGALSLAVVRTSFGEGHLVLTVRTDRGDFVLDNRRPAIVPWNRTGYAWLKRQSVNDPQYWVAVSTRPARLTRPAIRPPVVEGGPIAKPADSMPLPAENTVIATARQDMFAAAPAPLTVKLTFPLDVASWEYFSPAEPAATGSGVFRPQMAQSGFASSAVALAFSSVGEFPDLPRVE